MKSVCTNNDFVSSNDHSSIYLQNNRIDALPAWAFCFYQQFEIVDLSRNKISHIDKNAFSGVLTIRSLDLRRNAIVAFMCTDLPVLYVDIGTNKVNHAILSTRHARNYYYFWNEMGNMPVVDVALPLVGLYLCHNQVSISLR